MLVVLKPRIFIVLLQLINTVFFLLLDNQDHEPNKGNTNTSKNVQFTATFFEDCFNKLQKLVI